MLSTDGAEWQLQWGDLSSSYSLWGSELTPNYLENPSASIPIQGPNAEED